MGIPWDTGTSIPGIKYLLLQINSSRPFNGISKIPIIVRYTEAGTHVQFDYTV